MSERELLQLRELLSRLDPRNGVRTKVVRRAPIYHGVIAPRDCDRFHPSCTVAEDE